MQKSAPPFTLIFVDDFPIEALGGGSEAIAEGLDDVEVIDCLCFGDPRAFGHFRRINRTGCNTPCACSQIGDAFDFIDFAIQNRMRTGKNVVVVSNTAVTRKRSNKGDHSR